MTKTEDIKDPVDYRTFLVIILCFIVGAAFVILLAFIVRLGESLQFQSNKCHDMRIDCSFSSLLPLSFYVDPSQ